MRLIWQQGPLTVAEAHSLSQDLQLTTVGELLRRLAANGYLTTALEPSSAPTGGRPKKRYSPRVSYSMGLEPVVRKFLADYLLGDRAGLSLLAQIVQTVADSPR